MIVEQLEQLKALDIDRVQTDHAMALIMFATQLRAEYEKRNTAPPAWLDDRIRSLGRYLEMKRRDTLELRLKEVKVQQTQLLTPSERREALKAEEESLTTQLAGAGQ